MDYCNVTNISFFFMRERSPETYYLHASIPNQIEVNFKNLNRTIRKGLNKSKSFNEELPTTDDLRLYTVYLDRDI